MIDIERKESITTIRKYLLGFIHQEISFDNFYDKIKYELGSTFDPLDWTTEDLPKDLKIEIDLYSRLTGGEFGETDHLIPKHTNWEYGKSKEKYGWIDVEKYRQLFREEYTKLKLIDLD